MKYYKQLNENSEVVYLLSYDTEPNITDPLTVEITAEEYEAISAEWREAARVRAEAKKAEKRAKAREKALKAKAYDIITGVSE